MPQLLPFKKILDEGRDQEKQDIQLAEDAKSFKLANLNTIATIAEICVLGICAILNWNFFSGTIKGAMGYVVGTLAIVLECLAFFCWQGISKSAGKYRIALISCAITLTTVAAAHASIEWWKDTGVIQQASAQIQFYADYLALFTLIALLAGASFWLKIAHWQSAISRERAKSEERVAIARAGLVGAKAEMDAETQLDRARVRFLNDQLETANEAVDAIEKIAATHERSEQALSRLNGSPLAENLRRQFGTIAKINSGNEEAEKK
jgi:hypothetical protein